MSLILAGRIVPLSRDPAVAPTESASFRGRVYVGDDGRIAAIRRSRQTAPPGFGNAVTIDVGTSLIVPGLIDMHNHLAYAPLPLWAEAGRTQPFGHHNIWPSRPSYAAEVTWPAYAYVVAAPAELLAYAEVRALIGGATSIQGSPPSNRPLDGWLIRNIEDETLGGTLNRNTVLASTLTMKPQDLGSRAGTMARGSTFIYHCAEGQRGSIVAREFEAVRTAGCLLPQLVAIHTNALDTAAYAAWAAAPGAVVWSPFSNLWLYGEKQTVDVPTVRSHGISLCLGSDWAPSGTRNILGELKVARLVSDSMQWQLSDFDLVKMVTASPGDVLKAAWRRTVGRLEPGALGDITVIAAGARADPFTTIVKAIERDVQLVLVGGKPVYGTKPLMRQAGATGTSALVVAGETRALQLTRFDGSDTSWSFDQVLARMEQVRQNPKKEIDGARARAHAGAVGGEPPSLRLALDMPTGLVPIGGLPKDLAQIVVPPIQPLEHDAAFFAQVNGRGFHAGLLNGLAGFYS